MRKIFCDKCGDQLTQEQIKTVMVNHPDIANAYQYFDFCAACEQEFRDFLATKKKQRLDTAAGK
jgi:hypothetical protein